MHTQSTCMHPCCSLMTRGTFLIKHQVYQDCGQNTISLRIKLDCKAKMLIYSCLGMHAGSMCRSADYQPARARKHAHTRHLTAALSRLAHHTAVAAYTSSMQNCAGFHQQQKSALQLAFDNLAEMVSPFKLLPARHTEHLGIICCNCFRDVAELV